MGQVVSFINYTPPARFDSVPWTQVLVYESTTSQGPWTLIDTITFGTVDPDPTSPQTRSFTTEAGTGPELWYHVVFRDGSSDVTNPSDPIQNSDLPQGSQYVSADDLKRSLTLAGTTFADHDITPAINSASRAVDEYCGRHFGRDASVDSVRWYRPTQPTLIIIDDLVELTELRTFLWGPGSQEKVWVGIEGLPDQAPEFALEPLNAVADGFPYTRISLNLFRPSYGFPSWSPQSVQVTGKFGWPSLPDQVKTATALLATRLVKRIREAPFGVITVGMDVGAAMRIAKTDPEVSGLLAPFVREKVISHL